MNKVKVQKCKFLDILCRGYCTLSVTYIQRDINNLPVHHHLEPVVNEGTLVRLCAVQHLCNKFTPQSVVCLVHNLLVLQVPRHFMGLVAHELLGKLKSAHLIITQARHPVSLHPVKLILRVNFLKESILKLLIDNHMYKGDVAMELQTDISVVDRFLVHVVRQVPNELKKHFLGNHILLKP